MGRKPAIVGANEEVQGCFGEDRITNGDIDIEGPRNKKSLSRLCDKH